MHRKFLYFAVAALSLLCLANRGWAQAEPPDRIPGTIDLTQRVVTNAVHPLATRQNDTGRVNGAQVFHRMVMLLQRSDAQEAELEQLLADQQNPKSAQYHHWLTPAEFGRRFGPSQNDLATLTGWLKGQGFSVEAPPNGRGYLVFTGTSGQVEAAFQTEMHHYAVNGKTYMANAKPASVPKAFAGVVRGVASLNSFHPFLPQSYPADKPQIQIAPGYAATGPADLAAIYNAAPLNAAGISGQGQSVALIEESNIDPSDLADFRTLTGLPAANLNVIVNGPDPGKLNGDGEEFEAIADVEYAGAMDPQATLNVVVTESTEFTQGILLSTFYAVDNLVSPVTSLSYGGCETLNDTFYGPSVGAFTAAYEQGAAEGISEFVSSGDEGGDACLGLGLPAGYGVNAIGDSPWNVSVGGTEFIMPNPDTYFPPPNYTATGYIPESTWNDYENPEDGRTIAGSGGVSINFTKPAWQAGPGVPADGQRDVPDVSLLAGDNLYYLTCEKDIGDDCSAGFAGGVIGTSLASPNWAAIQTLVNQKNKMVLGSGNPNPVYYMLAAGANSPFHDITVGDTKVPEYGGLVGYFATTGFDLATGLGSVDVNALATAWQMPTGSGTATVSLSTTAAHVQHGAALTANVAVTATAATGPTGDVVLMGAGQGILQLTLSSGAAAFQFGSSIGSFLPGGSYNLTAHYAGDVNFAPADSAPVALVIDPEPTVLQAAGTGYQVYFGEPVTLSAEAVGTVSGETVPGTYTFTENGTSLGTASIAATGESFSSANTGVFANLTLSGAQSLPAGTHNIVAASPAASASYLASAPDPISVAVLKAPVLVALTPDHTNPPLNSTVNLFASVNNLYGSYQAPMTGTVDFYDGNTKIASGMLAAKADPTGAFDATAAVQFTTPGVHSIIAIYDGDSNDQVNESGIVNITVSAKSPTSLTIIGPSLALASTSTQIQATLTGDANGTAPTGMVTFTDASANQGQGASIGTAMVDANGAAVLNATSLAAGTHNIYASYAGDANYSGSISQAFPMTVGDFTVTAAPASASVTAGQSTTSITLTFKSTTNLSPASIFGGSQATVALACSGLPAGAACDFTSTSITPTVNQDGTTSGTTTLTISTEGPTLQVGALRHPGSAAPLAFCGLLVLGLPLILRRRRLLASLLALTLLAFATGITACSSTSGKYIITNPGTPAGNSTVAVTATVNLGAQSLAHTANISLTVSAAGGTQ